MAEQPRKRARRDAFRPFWPTAATPPRSMAVAPIEQVVADLRATDADEGSHEDARHNLLWTL